MPQPKDATVDFWDFVQTLSILSYIALMVAVLWFVLAVGVPLRRWLQRELGTDERLLTGGSDTPSRRR